MTLSNKPRKITYEKILITCIITSSVIPDLGIKFTTFGFIWTTGRIMLVLEMVGMVIVGKKIRIDNKTISSKWIRLIVFWLVYGLIFLLISKYSDTHNGILECFSLFNALAIFIMLKQLLSSDENQAYAIYIVYWLLNVMLLIAFIEIIIGKHLSSSAFYDNNSSVSLLKNTHAATGFMYNMNDFSALITCMSPVLVLKRFGNKRIVSLIGILVVNLINDATACTLAIVVFMLYYLLIIKGGKTQRAFLLKMLFWVIETCLIIIILFTGEQLTARSDFFGAMARQIYNAKQGFGSLSARIIIYKDAIKAWVSTGFFGMGPSSFTKYFTINQSLSGLVNPHSLLLEILTEYGIIIFAWFCILLFRLFNHAKKLYSLATKDNQYLALMIIAYIIIYVIASFAPSSFLGYTYQWVLLVVMSSQIDNLIYKNGGLGICSDLL